MLMLTKSEAKVKVQQIQTLCEHLKGKLIDILLGNNPPLVTTLITIRLATLSEMINKPEQRFYTEGHETKKYRPFVIVLETEDGPVFMYLEDVTPCSTSDGVVFHFESVDIHVRVHNVTTN